MSNGSAYRVALIALAATGCASAEQAANGDGGARFDGGVDLADSGLEQVDATPGLFPDAGSIDASPIDGGGAVDAGPEIDAAVDAGCSPALVDLLGNGSFDATPAVWTQTSSGGFALIAEEADIQASLPSFFADTGSKVGWLAGYDDADDRVQQIISVPADATPLRLRGKVWIVTAEDPGLVWDTLRVEIANAASGAILETILTRSNEDANTSWASFDETASSSYAGQNIVVRVRGLNDFTNPTNFFVDSLSLETTACP